MFLNTPVFDEIFHLSPIMDFTDEENEWLEKISLEIPGNSELTALEERLSNQAKPRSVLEALVFQITASLKFGFIKLLSPIPVSLKHSDNRSAVSFQCRYGLQKELLGA